jgi:TetR/AcrR family transcriptional repressor of mexCD-oprJ operon
MAAPRIRVDHRRATAERNVEAILDAAERLLQRRAQASIAAVARESGVSRVTVYAHFSTREELLEAVVERAVRAATAAIERAEPDRGPPPDALERIISVSWREIERHDAIRRAAAEELSAAAITRSHQAAAESLGRLLDRGRIEGSFRTDLPEHWLVVSFFALLHAAADEVREGRIEAEGAIEAAGTSIRELFSASRKEDRHHERRPRGRGRGRP